MTLENQSVIVTGGSRGLGLGIVEALVERGARVTVVARGAHDLSTVSQRLDVHTICADVTEATAAQQILAEVSPDILILNAGIDPGCPPELARTAVKRLRRGQLVIFPYATHGVNRNSPCAGGIARTFLRDPSRPVDQSCVAAEQTGFHFDRRG